MIKSKIIVVTVSKLSVQLSHLRFYLCNQWNCLEPPRTEKCTVPRKRTAEELFNKLSLVRVSSTS